MARYEGRVTVDLGTGDGQAVLRLARQHPHRLIIGIDADREALAEGSRRAARKPQRGGAPNTLFVHASVEALPAELDGSAEAVDVLFPWGSLLRTVVQPDIEVLAQVRRLCRAGAAFEAVLSIDPARDGREAARLGLASEGALSVALLSPGYRAAGFHLCSVEPMAREAVAALPSVWAKRLAHGRPRPVWRLRAEVSERDAHREPTPPAS